ncbi:MAG: MerR family transcriptional regulator [Cyanobacteria bacterium SZAS LIN-2]|nr:MerR family transcriptional regulator [Cyanobacteria bacterium SZAS LIN-3]MBS1996379.1 MerR family transcriptional regulator [Cyanobacteria bacterium SZAS LIN-2]MBS2007104.1 MerR family transcriptional regulator [Cyanobacteria bacterium SZAS TMP-1]
MIANSSYALTIEELCEEIARLLKANDLSDSLQDNRISTVPDMRTIRYYTTLGLIDRPLIVGRVAKYNRRHILQIIAIKTMQRATLPLTEIQELLFGLSEAELEALIDAVILDQKKMTQTKVPVLATRETIRPNYWREIVLEPGLKIMADQSWVGDVDWDELQVKIRQAIEALQHATPGNNGEAK